MPLYNLVPAGTNGQIQFNDNNLLAGIPGSSVLPSTNLSAGSVALAGLSVGTSTPLNFGTYRFLVRSGATQMKDATSNTYFESDNAGSVYIGDVSSAYGTARLNLSNDASLTASSSVFINNTTYGNFIGIDGNGYVTMRATGDTGGIYATDSYTNIGHYSFGNYSLIDANGWFTIGSPGSPSSNAQLQVGGPIGSGGFTEMSGVNRGGQIFFDYASGDDSQEASFRIFTGTQCGEFFAVGSAGSYFSNTNQYDTGIKGDPGGGNAMRFGIGSGNAQFNIDSTTNITFIAHQTMSDGFNLVFNTTTGTKIGTGTTQKLSFWNATPVAQYSTTGTSVGFTAGAGTTATSLSTFTGNTGTKAYTVGDIVRALKLSGIMAAS